MIGIMALLVAASLSAASNPVSLSGDFDGDGRTDSARIIGNALIVTFDRPAGPSDHVALVLPRGASSLKLSLVLSGRYETACGKGYLRATDCADAPRSVTIENDAINLFTPESANQYVYWTGDRFAAAWMSD